MGGFGLLLAACAVAEARVPDPAELYRDHCAVCHGDRGDAQTRVRDSLTPPPRDFTAPGIGVALGRERMIRAVTEGRPGTAMVAFAGQLSDASIAALVDYIRAEFMATSATTTPASPPLSGGAVYEKHCAVCHGDNGNTAVWARNGLKPAPRDFTTTDAARELSRMRMMTSVTHGRPGTAMMPFQNRLSEAEINAVVDYISNKFMRLDDTPEPAPGDRREVAQSRSRSGDATAVDMARPLPSGLVGDAAKGRDFYMRNCFTCHGTSGQGDGPRAHFNFPRPRDFTSAESRAIFNRPRLFHAVTNGKPGTVMPAWGKVLTPQQLADVAEFVFQAFIKGGEGTRPTTGAPEAQNKGVSNGMRSGEARHLALGREIYNYRCYFCHGYNGDAHTLASTYLEPKPRDFTRTDARTLTRKDMIQTVSHGRQGTAMKGFEGILETDDIEAVVDFVRETFIATPRFNTRYHTPANGWPDHEQYSLAYPFVLGEVPLDTPWEQLGPQQQAGKQLYLASCISCHDRATVGNEGAIWEARPLSFPRNQYSHTAPDAISSASVYALHDRSPRLAALTDEERHGERLFQQNCAFCHGADGSGRNWIGRFIEPHPRDLTDTEAMALLRDGNRLKQAIRDGVPGSAMPAWKTVLADEQIDAIIAYITRAFLSET